MSLFQNILSQIKAKIDQEKDRREEISEIIKEVTALDIKETQIILKKGTAFISTVPTTKMALLIKKDRLLTAFKEKNIPIHTIV